MDGQYIVPVIGQTYLNRNGGEYRCTGNMCYESDEQMRRALSLGEHRASLVRIKDGWSLIAHGMIQYADGSIEWNYSSGGTFHTDTPFAGCATAVPPI